MINISPINAIQHKLARIAEAGDNIHSFLINPISHEVLSKCTVITIRDLLIWIGLRILRGCPATVVQILNVDEVDVTVLVPIILAASYQTTKYFFSEKCRADS